jgi:hypothetical protein
MKLDLYHSIAESMRANYLDLLGVALGAASYAANRGEQITNTRELGLWLLVGALTGACAAVAIPDGVEAKVHFAQRAFACFLLSVIVTVGVFSFTSMAMTSDKIFFTASAIGATGWFSIPVIRQSVVSIGTLVPEVLKALPEIIISWVKKRLGVG